MKRALGAVLLLTGMALSQRADGAAVRTANAATRELSAAVRIERQGNHLFVAAQIQGSPLTLVFDTASQRTLIDEAVARRLRLPVRLTNGLLKGIGETSTPLLEADDVDLSIGGLDAYDLNVVVTPLTQLTPFMGRPIDGILGWDVLQHVRTEIDLDRGVLTFSQGGKPAAGDAGWVPLSMRTGVPSVTVDLAADGRTVSSRFELDTGATAAVILRRNFVEHNGLSTESRITRRAAGIGGTAEFAVRRIDGISIAGYTVVRPVAELSRTTAGAVSGAETAGLLGVAFLDSFRVTLDPVNGRALFVPSSKFGKPLTFRYYGVGMTPDQQSARTRFRVHSVAPASPAEESGLRVGDVVEKVNGRSAGELTLGAITAAMQRNDRVTLQVARAGESFELSIAALTLE